MSEVKKIVPAVFQNSNAKYAAMTVFALLGVGSYFLNYRSQFKKKEAILKQDKK